MREHIWQLVQITSVLHFWKCMNRWAAEESIPPVQKSWPTNSRHLGFVLHGWAGPKNLWCLAQTAVSLAQSCHQRREIAVWRLCGRGLTRSPKKRSACTPRGGSCQPLGRRGSNNGLLGKKGSRWRWLRCGQGAATAVSIFPHYSFVPKIFCANQIKNYPHTLHVIVTSENGNICTRTA